jgi:cytoskeletal protein CcmA (bactofilin family)
MGLFGKSRNHVHTGSATIIAESCTFRGEIKGLKGPLYVEGTVEGAIYSEAEVIIGPKGKVLGEVRARQIIVNGYLEGDVVCEKVDIMAAGTLQGELMAQSVTIEEGGRFLGESRELGDGDMQVNILQITLPELEATSDEVEVTKKVEKMRY